MNSRRSWGLAKQATLQMGCPLEVANGADLPENLEVPWVCLFYEHRRWRYFGTEPKPEDLIYLNLLCQAFADAVRHEPRLTASLIPQGDRCGSTGPIG